jgi:hypothetical protein
VGDRGPGDRVAPADAGLVSAHGGANENAPGQGYLFDEDEHDSPEPPSPLLARVVAATGCV